MALPNFLRRKITPSVATAQKISDFVPDVKPDKSCFVFLTNNNHQYVAYTRYAITTLRKFSTDVPVFVLSDDKNTKVPEADRVINISSQLKEHKFTELAFGRFPALIFGKFLMPYIKELEEFDRVIIYDPDVEFRTPEFLNLMRIPFDGKMALLCRDPNNTRCAANCLRRLMAAKLVNAPELKYFKTAFAQKEYGNVGLIVWNMKAINNKEYDDIVRFIPKLQNKTRFSLPEQDCLFCTIPYKPIPDTYNALIKFTPDLKRKSVWHYTGPNEDSKIGLRKHCRRSGFDTTFQSCAAIKSREALDRPIQKISPFSVKGYSFVGRENPTVPIFSDIKTDTLGKGKDYKACITWDSVDSHSNYKATALALRDKCPLVLCESGPIGSITPYNAKSDPINREVLSAIADMSAYNYDSWHQSDLERRILSARLSERELERARKNIKQIVSNKISKYNHQPLSIPEPGTKGRKKVLLIDQDIADTSVFLARGTKEVFDKMLQDAIRDNPDCDILVKTHPIDILGGKTTHGCYMNVSGNNVVRVTYPVNPYTLMEYVDKVYVNSSAFGFEALMAGKEVHTYGMPWYAGWGITKDYFHCPRRTEKKTLEELFHGFYIWYSRWYNPITKKACEIEETIEVVKLLRRLYLARKH